ncbi:MAG: trigger factor [Bacilli bacterium]|jgi:trigger factor
MANKNKHEIIIKVEKKEWEEALNKSFSKNIQEVKVDGFRKGKAPRDVYEKKYGRESLYMDAVDYVLPSAYNKALSTSKLMPVVQPQVDIKSITDDGVEILFTITTKPPVKIDKYKGLKVKKEVVKVTNEEVMEEIEKLKKRYAEIIIKDKKIEAGDIAVIDFEGFKEGVAFEGGKGQDYSLEIGSKTFIPGFEEQLVGMKKNETKEIKLTFPAEYPSKELQNQPVIFKVTVKEVKEKKIPELKAAFFKDLALDGVKDLESLEKELKASITASKEAQNENIYLDNLFAAIAKNVTVDVPDEMIKEEVNRMLGRYKEQLQMQGIDINQYYQMTKTTESDLKKQMHPEAKKHVIYRMMLEEIAKLEKITVTEDEAKKEAKRLSTQYQMEEEKFLDLFGGLEMIKYDLQMRRTIEFLKDNN